MKCGGLAPPNAIVFGLGIQRAALSVYRRRVYTPPFSAVIFTVGPLILVHRVTIPSIPHPVCSNIYLVFLNTPVGVGFSRTMSANLIQAVTPTHNLPLESVRNPRKPPP